jgi:hypothetical protein
MFYFSLDQCSQRRKKGKGEKQKKFRFFGLRDRHSYKSAHFYAFFGETQKARGAMRHAPDEFFYIQVQFITIFRFNMTLKHLGFFGLKFYMPSKCNFDEMLIKMTTK